eukprot:7274015-Pyramimonas_sp.AAC.1
MLRRLTSVDVLNGGLWNTSGRRREGRWHVQCRTRGQTCQLSQLVWHSCDERPASIGSGLACNSLNQAAVAVASNNITPFLKNVSLPDGALQVLALDTSVIVVRGSTRHVDPYPAHPVVTFLFQVIEEGQ